MQSVAMHRNKTLVTIQLVFALKKKSGGKREKNTDYAVQKPTVVLSARSFSMTSISWSFCSGSKLQRKEE